MATLCPSRDSVQFAGINGRRSLMGTCQNNNSYLYLPSSICAKEGFWDSPPSRNYQNKSFVPTWWKVEFITHLCVLCLGDVALRLIPDRNFLRLVA